MSKHVVSWTLLLNERDRSVALPTGGGNLFHAKFVLKMVYFRNQYFGVDFVACAPASVSGSSLRQASRAPWRICSTITTRLASSVVLDDAVTMTLTPVQQIAKRDAFRDGRNLWPGVAQGSRPCVPVR
jgi:hypothetical protein